MYKNNSIALKLIIATFFIVSPFTVLANFDFNKNCLKAYQSIFELKLQSAKQLIAAEKRIHPNNSIVPLLENYLDYFYLLTTESKTDFEKLKENKSTRLNRIEEDKETNSPYCLYAQAEINLQWALIRGRYGEYFTAAREIRKANSLLLQNKKKFPDFHLNLKGLGLINSVLGNLPDGILKNALSAFGIKGDLQTGIVMLDKLAENLPKSSYEPFYDEVVFYYTYVLSDIAHSPSAYSKTMKYTDRIPDSSLLKSYLQAYVCTRSGRNDEAISILSNRPTGLSYAPFAYLDLLTGIARLNKLDYSASGYFNKFLQENKGSNYIKDANLHLAWIYLLKGDINLYNRFIARVKSMGYTFQEKDKQALNEASAPIPNPILLKSRLLFDGGYFSKALAILSEEKPENYSANKDKTEFYYRLGRINDEMGRDDLALSAYENAVNLGKNLEYYYAANSALLMGKIYEKKRNISKAKIWYNIAIDMKDHEDESSIETQAKQGLKRIGN